MAEQKGDALGDKATRFWAPQRLKEKKKMMIYVKLSFREHLKYACQKAATSAELAKILPNVGRSKTDLKLLLAGGTFYSTLRFTFVGGCACKVS